MNQYKLQDFLIQNVTVLEGVGLKTKKILKKKKNRKNIRFIIKYTTRIY